MVRYFRRLQIPLAVCGLLLIGGAVALAQHNSTFTRLFTAGAEAMASSAGSTAPQAVTSNKPLVKIVLSGVVERDSKKISVDNAGPVKPGEVVSFTMRSTNEGSSPARDYRAVGQIPRGTAFVANSATGERDSRVSYSIDGGKQFSSKPMIDEKQPDGTVKKVSAPVTMYTQVRFEWADPLAAGTGLVASYQVRVK